MAGIFFVKSIFSNKQERLFKVIIAAAEKNEIISVYALLPFYEGNKRALFVPSIRAAEFNGHNYLAQGLRNKLSNYDKSIVLRSNEYIKRIFFEKNSKNFIFSSSIRDFRTIKDYLNDYSLLHYAVLVDDIDIVKTLLDFGCDIDVKSNSFGETPLMIALRNRRNQLSSFLIKRGAHLNVSNYAGYTPLMLSVVYFDLDSLKYILDKNINIEARRSHPDGFGDNALLLAVKCHNYEAVKLLLKAGSDINVVDYLGQTPISIAEKEKSRQLLNILNP